MTVFVLVHGNFHDGSAWKGVSRCLEQLGHITHAPTLPGHGRDVPTNVGYRDAAESVAGYVVQRDLRDIVLVGHSGGGVAISHTVEIIADRVQRLVYLSGWVLQDGESILEMLAHYRELFDGMAAQSPDDTVEVPFDVWGTISSTTPTKPSRNRPSSNWCRSRTPTSSNKRNSPPSTVDGAEVLHPADRGHRLASRRRMGLASAHDQPARRAPVPPDAGQP